MKTEGMGRSMFGEYADRNIQCVDISTFEKKHLHAKRPILLACVDQECSSKRQKELLLDVSARYEKSINVLCVEEGSMSAFLKRFNVIGTPTYLIFTDGIERDRWLGIADVESFKTFVSESLAETTNS